MGPAGLCVTNNHPFSQVLQHIFCSPYHPLVQSTLMWLQGTMGVKGLAKFKHPLLFCYSHISAFSVLPCANILQIGSLTLYLILLDHTHFRAGLSLILWMQICK